MKVEIKKLGLLFILFIGMNSAFAQWDTTWQQTYGGNRDDVANDMILTPDNGFLLIGSTSSFGFNNSQMYFLKLDSIGNIMWSKSHGGEQQEVGTSVIQTSDGGYLGVGYTNSWGEGGYDIFLVKLDANGNLEYEAVKGGFDWDFAWDVIETSPGKYVIAAETQSYGNGNTDGWLLQFDEATKTWDWGTTVGTYSTENLKAVAKGNNNDFFAVGMGHENAPNDSDIMVVRFNAAGDSLNTYFYGDTLLDYGNDIVKLSTGNYGITGTRQFVGQKPGVALLKITDSGTIINDTNWSVTAFETGTGNQIFEIPALRVCITGTVTKQEGNTDMYLAYSFPASHHFELGNTHGSNFLEQANAALYLNNKGFILAGQTDGYKNSFLNILTVKTDTAVQLDSPNAFYYNEDSVNVTTVRKISLVDNSIFYNSTTNTISIEYNEPFKFIVFDIMGRIVSRGTINRKLQLNSLGLKSGMFIIKVYNENNYWSTQVLLNSRY